MENNENIQGSKCWTYENETLVNRRIKISLQILNVKYPKYPTQTYFHLIC